MAIGSFLRKLAGPAAGVATSLIPGVGPALAPMVGGAVGMLANRGGGGASGGGGGAGALPPIDEEEVARRKRIAGGLEGLQTTATDTSGRLLGGAEQALGGARGFYSKLAGGDPASVGAAFAPQLNQARRLHQGAIDQVEQFAPRGGGRTGALAGERIARAGTLANITAQAPYLGAKGLQDLAQTGGSLGLGSGELGLGAGRTAADIGLKGEGLGLERAQVGQGDRRLDLVKREQDIDLYGGLGKGIADVLGTTGIAGKIGKGISGLFGGGGPKPIQTPTSFDATTAQIPLGTNAPPVPPPVISPGPVTSQFATAYSTAKKKPLSALA